MKIQKLFLAIILVLTILTTSSFAIDFATCGGNVTCECGDHVINDYTMTSNLTCSNNALIIEEDDITLDCDGYLLEGEAQEGYGVYLNDINNATIKNCNINYFETGIYMEGGDYSVTIDNNTIWDNDEGGIFGMADSYINVQILNNLIYANDYSSCGYDDAGGGVRIQGTDYDVSILNVTLNDNIIENDGGGNVRIGWSDDDYTALKTYIYMNNNILNSSSTGGSWFRANARDLTLVDFRYNDISEMDSCPAKIGFAGSDDLITKNIDLTFIGNNLSEVYGIKVIATDNIDAVMKNNTFEDMGDYGTIRLGFCSSFDEVENITADISGNTFYDVIGGAIVARANDVLNVEYYDNFINYSRGKGRGAIEAGSNNIINAEIYDNYITDSGNKEAILVEGSDLGIINIYGNTVFSFIDYDSCDYSDCEGKNALYISGNEDNDSTINIYDNEFARNGKGIYLESLFGAILSNNTIYDNCEGMYLDNSEVTVKNTNFTGNNPDELNYCSGGDATGLYVEGDSTVYLENSDFIDNGEYGIYDGGPENVFWTLTDEVTCQDNDLRFYGWIAPFGGSLLLDDCDISINGDWLEFDDNQNGYAKESLTSEENEGEYSVGNPDMAFEIYFYLDSSYDDEIEVLFYNEVSENTTPFKTFGKYIDLSPTDEMDLDEYKLKVYYSDDELEASNIDESLLRLYYYDDDEEKWEIYDNNYGGVNTENNFVWADIDHFSLFGIFEAPTCGDSIACECGDYLIDDYTLTDDLFCADSGLTIAKDDITLDCDGYLLEGENQDGYGIYLNNINNALIQNCEINYFETGIYMQGNIEKVTINNNNIWDNNYGGIYGNITQNITFLADNNTIIDNGCDGSLYAGGGIRINGQNDSIIRAKITNNYINQSDSSGDTLRLGWASDNFTASKVYLTLTNNILDAYETSYHTMRINALNYIDINAKHNTFLSYNDRADNINQIGYDEDYYVKNMIVTFENNTFENTGKGGIRLLASDNLDATIVDNIFRNVYEGGALRIGFSCSSTIITENTTTTISGNKFYNVDGGPITVMAEDKLTATINDNLINESYGGSRKGIEVISNGILNADIYNNTLKYLTNNYGIFIEGDDLETINIYENNVFMYNENVDYSNFDQKVALYLYGNEDDNSTINIYDNEFAENGQGIYLENVIGALLYDNLIYNNCEGMYLDNSEVRIEDTNFTGNNPDELSYCDGGGDTGLYIDGSSTAYLKNSDFINNGDFGIYDEGPENVYWSLYEEIICQNNDVNIVGWIIPFGGKISGENCTVNVRSDETWTNYELNLSNNENGFVGFTFDTDENNTAIVGGEDYGLEIELHTNEEEGAEVEIVFYSENPGSSNYSLDGFNKWLNIEPTNNLNLSHWILKVYYTNEELANSGLRENTLEIEYYNNDTELWETLPGEVNTTGNYVWANITHFSTFGLFGEEQTCSDGIKNQDETNVDCGGVCTNSKGKYWYDNSCHKDDDSSSGGGSGSSNSQIGSFSAIFGSMNPGGVIEIIFGGNSSNILGINLSVKTKLSDVKFTIKDLFDDIGNNTELKIEYIYKYLEIIHENLENADLDGDVTIIFKVPKSWVDEMGISPEDIILYRLTDDWDELKITFLGLENGFYKFSAEAPGMSYFAIGAEEEEIENVVVKPEVETSTNTVIDTSQKTNIKEDSPILDNEVTISNNYANIKWLIGLIVLIILAGFIVYEGFIRTNHHKIETKQKSKTNKKTKTNK